VPSASPVPDWVPDDLPRAPGVYEFRNARGSPLYVGKSVDVRRRVRSYFYGDGPERSGVREMLGMARRVRVRRAGSDLEARLVEARRILDARPPYNRALKNRAHGWYLEMDWSVPFPRLRVVRRAAKRRAEYFGPFRGKRLPSEIAELTRKIFRLRSCRGRLSPDARSSPCLQHGVKLCTAPCTRVVSLDRYREQARTAARTLREPGFAVAVRERLVAERERLAAAWEFERAADRQRRIEWLDELRSHRAELERPALERSWLIRLPGPERDRHVLVPVARGRVLETVTAPRREDAWRPVVEDVCYQVRLAELRLEPVFPPEELVPSLIVTRWLEGGARGGVALDLEGLEPAQVIDRLRASPPTRGAESRAVGSRGRAGIRAGGGASRAALRRGDTESGAGTACSPADRGPP